jgi:anti-sigma regulatory factor (Ser/Thr protein kinase)
MHTHLGMAVYPFIVAANVQTQERRRQELSLAAEPEAVAEARRWAVGIADGLVQGDVQGDLRLIMSEVVTNALRHGAPGKTIDLAITPKDEFLCVQVTDEGSGFVPSPGAMASEPGGGFGLYLVEKLTRRWGMTRENMRTRVWFEFDYGAA